MIPSWLRSLPYLVLGLAAATASGQDFELDLSEDSSPAVQQEFRPTLAVLEVIATDGEAVSESRARQLETELLEAVGKSDRFQSVLTPAQAKAQLGETPSNCSELDCFKAARAKLKVHRVVRLTVQRSGAGSLVTVVGLDPSLPALTRASLDSAEKAEKTFMGVAGRTQGQRDRDFLRKLVPMSLSALKKLATANGKLIVDNRDPAVTVFVDGEPVGTGRVEVVVQRGTRTVSIDGSVYEPFTQAVTIEPLKSASVDVRLVAKPLARPVAQVSTSSTPVTKRPGLYLALAGAVAAAVGVGLGVSTQGVQQRIDAGGRPVEVTRAEAVSAQTNAVLANVLVAGGAVMVAGGITWIILTPSAPTTAGEPTDSPGPSGWTLQLGGNF